MSLPVRFIHPSETQLRRACLLLPRPFRKSRAGIDGFTAIVRGRARGMRMPPCTIRCATACFGGRGFKYSDVTQGVWVLSLNAAPSWSRLDVAGKQPKRAFGEPEPETWVLPLSDRSTWSRLEIPEPRPTGRTGHTAIFD